MNMRLNGPTAIWGVPCDGYPRDLVRLVKAHLARAYNYHILTTDQADRMVHKACDDEIKRRREAHQQAEAKAPTLPVPSLPAQQKASAKSPAEEWRDRQLEIRAAYESELARRGHSISGHKAFTGEQGTMPVLPGTKMAVPPTWDSVRMLDDAIARMRGGYAIK